MSRMICCRMRRRGRRRNIHVRPIFPLPLVFPLTLVFPLPFVSNLYLVFNLYLVSNIYLISNLHHLPLSQGIQRKTANAPWRDIPIPWSRTVSGATLRRCGGRRMSGLMRVTRCVFPYFGIQVRGELSADMSVCVLIGGSEREFDRSSSHVWAGCFGVAVKIMARG